MENPFRRNREKILNVVQEVGRDPLRIPRSTPLSDTVETARRLTAAKRKLMTVLPQPVRIEHLPTIGPIDPGAENEFAQNQSNIHESTATSAILNSTDK